MKTIDIITELKSYINTLSEDDKKYIDFCVDHKQTAKAMNIDILADLMIKLQADYRHEEAKKQGGNIGLKRQKIAEKILKQNKKDGMKEQFFKCWIEEIDGEKMQLFGNQYYIIALKEAFKTLAETETEAEKIPFKASKFFDKSQYEFNQIDFDLTEIKQQLAQFKAEQKLKPAKDRQKINYLPLGNSCYNAYFFIDIAEALGTDVVFYQNEKQTGISIFEAEAGIALICPCRV